MPWTRPATPTSGVSWGWMSGPGKARVSQGRQPRPSGWRSVASLQSAAALLTSLFDNDTDPHRERCAVEGRTGFPPIVRPMMTQIKG